MNKGNQADRGSFCVKRGENSAGLGLVSSVLSNYSHPLLLGRSSAVLDVYHHLAEIGSGCAHAHRAFEVESNEDGLEGSDACRRVFKGARVISNGREQDVHVVPSVAGDWLRRCHRVSHAVILLLPIRLLSVGVDGLIGKGGKHGDSGRERRHVLV